jgi:hypothetical protein
MVFVDGKHVFLDLVDERHQRRRARADPIGQCRYVEIDAFAGVDVTLAVQRQMRPVLREQHLGEQLRPGPPARDRMRRAGLGDGSHLRHENFSRTCWMTPLSRHELQRLSDILASLRNAPPQQGQRCRCMHARGGAQARRRAGLSFSMAAAPAAAISATALSCATARSTRRAAARLVEQL